MTNLTKKVVLITGAGWPPGREVAVSFGQQGAKVAVSDLTPVNLDPIVKEIQEAGGAAALFDADISKKIPAQTMITAVVEQWGQIDIVVNIVGVRPEGAILNLDEWDWRRSIDVNLTGPFLATQIIGRAMREIGGGRILFLASPPEERQVGSDRVAFQTALSGLSGFTRSAARELGEHNITVNAVFPSGALPTVSSPEPTPEAAALLSGAVTLAEAALRLVAPEATSISG
ncbi:MAG: SDR family NAD(P)-dependent oxidoreductase, partial [Anaerolineales bacterium]|nr:SDR family NAD(P)-dependent oxidoreductase [Anaerolineales bacterium]